MRGEKLAQIRMHLLEFSNLSNRADELGHERRELQVPRQIVARNVYRRLAGQIQAPAWTRVIGDRHADGPIQADKPGKVRVECVRIAPDLQQASLLSQDLRDHAATGNEAID